MRMEDITGLTGDTVEVSRSFLKPYDNGTFSLFQDVEEAQETQETSFEGGEGADCDSPRGAVQDV